MTSSFPTEKALSALSCPLTGSGPAGSTKAYTVCWPDCPFQKDALRCPIVVAGKMEQLMSVRGTGSSSCSDLHFHKISFVEPIVLSCTLSLSPFITAPVCCCPQACSLFCLLSLLLLFLRPSTYNMRVANISLMAGRSMSGYLRTTGYLCG